RLDQAPAFLGNCGKIIGESGEVPVVLLSSYKMLRLKKLKGRFNALDSLVSCPSNIDFFNNEKKRYFGVLNQWFYADLPTFITSRSEKERVSFDYRRDYPIAARDEQHKNRLMSNLYSAYICFLNDQRKCRPYGTCRF